MENTVIKNETPEMGKNIIKYFKNRGINTRGYEGFFSEKEKNCSIYYGVINDIFANYTIEEVEEYQAKIITLPVIFKRGDKVIVWDCDEKFTCQFDFVTYIEGAKHPFIVARNVNANDFDYIGYKNCKHVPQKVKLTLQQIADKFNINVDLIEIV